MGAVNRPLDIGPNQNEGLISKHDLSQRLGIGLLLDGWSRRCRLLQDAPTKKRLLQLGHIAPKVFRPARLPQIGTVYQ
jgi:hypothetical protein